MACEVNWQTIVTVASIAPSLAQIPVFMPEFTLKYEIKSYITLIGVANDQVVIWS
jgi:hypothetical protein